MTTLGTKAMGGIAAAAVSVGVATLVAAAFGRQADVRTSVGSAVIDLTPGPVKEWAIQSFGTADKLVLSVLVLVVIAVIAALAGVAESARRPVGSAVIVATGVAGCAAVLSRAGATFVDIVPTLVGTACGVAVLRLLISGRLSDVRDHVPDAAPNGSAAVDHPDRGRRLSLVTLGFLAVGAASGVAGTVISRLTSSVSGDRQAFALPRVDVPAPAIPASVQPKGVAQIGRAHV